MPDTTCRRCRYQRKSPSPTATRNPATTASWCSSKRVALYALPSSTRRYNRRTMRYLLLTLLTMTAGAEPVRLHPQNPHYFLYNGKPTVLLTSAEHYGAVLNQSFNYVRYLDTLAKDGLNYTRIFSGIYREVPNDFGIAKNTL